MKQGELLKKLKNQGCLFVKHCKKHDKYRGFPKTSVFGKGSIFSQKPEKPIKCPAIRK
jgi:hypothetical protein